MTDWRECARERDWLEIVQKASRPVTIAAAISQATPEHFATIVEAIRSGKPIAKEVAIIGETAHALRELARWLEDVERRVLDSVVDQA